MEILKSREVDYSPLEKQGEIEKEFRDRVESLCEANPEGEKILAGIDFAVLENIIAETLNASGIETRDMNFLAIDRVRFLKKNAKDSSAYNAGANLILIDYHFLAEYLKEYLHEAMLHSLIHEEVHAVSKTKVRLTEKAEARVEQSGYVRDRIFNCFAYVPFDEGVTEKIAEEIMEEYLKRTGATAESKDYLRELAENKIAYGEEKDMVNLVIKHLADKLSTSPAEIWKALKHGKFNGLDLDDPELTMELDEYFSQDKVDLLAQNRTAELIKIFKAEK